MKYALIKITTIGLTALVGTFASLSAIERPTGEKVKEEIPAKPVEPQGGILGDHEGFDELEGLTLKNLVIPQEKVAYLGVGGQESSETLLMHLNLESGLLLTTVDPTSPAGLAGLNEHDVIVEVDGTKLTDQDSLRAALAEVKPGDGVLLKLIRRGKSIEQKVTLGEAPARRNIQPLALVPNQAADMNRLLNEQLGNALGGFGNAELQKEMMEQLEKALGDRGAGFQQLRLDLGANMRNGEDMKMGIKGFGSVRLEDEEGSIEMKTKNGQRELAIRDKEGKLLFEGPYDSEIDKAAVPEDYRERVERLDMGNKGSFRLELNGKDLLERGKKKVEKAEGKGE
ncbi:MAG: membrane-associated protease RseP (regulator of RpoE activity) [Akkermansiaceae bacterium]|jgi:membrane-associated protease RseP (regulator of RpoE activity)